MKIVFLDASTLGDDIDYSQFEQLGRSSDIPSLLRKKRLHGSQTLMSWS